MTIVKEEIQTVKPTYSILRSSSELSIIYCEGSWSGFPGLDAFYRKLYWISYPEGGKDL